ncbi:acyl-CoA synthetase [Algoriphagus sediminis]|uniref:Acyl-CoA synthetase n=1 Tax=Algoriphagus sediminis TaxID=3057113 RepID=A0ABT7YD41_9BACT|nr:acyl-CoA synthetase [Algoriphagus sediminis]MDN3204439.1 acyl-CoA synthetase [Algoriphagus sediminis]
MIKLVERAQKFRNRIAIISDGNSFTYDQLLHDSAHFAQVLLGDGVDLHEQPIGILVNPGYEYVKAQWAVWRAGGTAVPIHPKAPISSIEYIFKDTGLVQIIVQEELLNTVQSLAMGSNVRLVGLNEKAGAPYSLPNVESGRRAMILYTSGTTGNPKGVVTTHSNIEAQVSCLVDFWQWTEEDHIINVLPLHHVHGIINVLSCALWSGAVCEFMPFDAEKVFKRIASKEVNLFMAVPTIYYKLITYWEECDENTKAALSEGLKNMRLMVSGSAALPVSVLEKWKSISGHILLERYGMTEIGMAVSNSYEGDRIPGHIGKPLPNVELKLVDEEGNEVSRGEDGEIWVKGPSVFKEYWKREEATRDAFSEDGWFKTGDIAIVNEGNLKIVGRSSVDIIKSGGYKLSALEIEEVIRKHPSIKDCGVVGIEDEEWGEIVAAALIPNEDDIDLEAFKEWMKGNLSSYKIPRKIKILEDLPRNAMGKVVKKELKKDFKDIS